MKHILLSAFALSFMLSCSGFDPVTVGYNPGTPYPDETTPDTPPAPAGDEFTIPAYDDNYASNASWASRSTWNLANVHDPSVMLADDGYYYMVQTDASYGNAHAGHGHFMCRRSKNLVDWEFLGATMPTMPVWLEGKVNEIRASLGLPASNVSWSDANTDIGYWAPCIRNIGGGKYRMYYSVNFDFNKTNTMAAATLAPNVIGLMETTNPADPGSWQDRGYVTTQYSDQGTAFAGKSKWGGYYKYNVIDPTYIITPEGQHWLIYGSWHSGFAAFGLSPDTGMPLAQQGNPWGDEAPYGKRVFTRYTSNRWQPSEGPEVVYRNGYYYLFIAFDNLSKVYNTRVVRSQNIDGPYLDITGQDFTNGTAAGDVYPIVTHPYQFAGDHGWVGISHCAVFSDGADNWYYASQQRFPENWGGNEYSNALMMGGVRQIIWTADGWPLVMPERYAAVPQTPITESELVGTWQHINLVYRPGNDNDSSQKHMDVSTPITLAADHTVAGTADFAGTWAYNAEKQQLTIGETTLYLTRALDWEAMPRRQTIAYAGLSKDGKQTFWGKKAN